MASGEHSVITKYAIGLLPEWQKDVIASEEDNLINEYCTLPDAYFGIKTGRHKKAKPYYFETDGIEFHYLPDSPIVNTYRYWRVAKGKNILERVRKGTNENWKHASRGFKYYIENSVNALRDSRIKDACAFIGWLLHVFQDDGFGWHSLEGGPYGTDIFVLDRLFPETEDVSKTPSAILARRTPISSVSTKGYKPEILGLIVDEAVFHLYTRYVRLTNRARRISFQIVENEYRRKRRDNIPLYKEMLRNNIFLCADVIFTILCIAFNRFETDCSHLMKIVLSDMEPVERPWGLSGPYRFVGITRNRALNLQSKYIPLRIMLGRGGKQKPVAFRKGFGMGGHYSFSIVYYLPKEIYKSFSSAIGLHSDFYKKGDVRVRLLLGKKLVYEGRFNKKKGGDEILIENPGGKLEFAVDASKGMEGIYNNIVWANPVLERKGKTKARK